MAEIEITELYLLERGWHFLRRVLKSVRDRNLATWHRISIFWHVEYLLQRTFMNDNIGRILLDIHCPTRYSIQADKL
jgi:hypothetical protein